MKIQTRCLAAQLILLGACATPLSAVTPAVATENRQVAAIALPGGGPDGVLLDYLAVDRARNRVWVPAGGTGRVDVIDATTGHLVEIPGFPTAEIERKGIRRKVGPSAASVGDGVVYVGSRGDSTVCAISADSLAKGPCVKLDGMPDGVVFVKRVQEVWVTTPRDNAIVVLDGSPNAGLRVKTRIALEGAPEGYAVDEVRGLFFTNLEDRDRTLTLDLKTHAVTQTWTSGCGEGGPKGLAIDTDWNLLLLACPDQVKVLDVAHQGAMLSSFPTGPGLDNIDYLASRHELFAAAGKAAKLTVARLTRGGKTRIEATVPTAMGARNAVATADGTAYLADGAHGQVLVVAPSK